MGCVRHGPGDVARRINSFEPAHAQKVVDGNATEFVALHWKLGDEPARAKTARPYDGMGGDPFAVVQQDSRWVDGAYSAIDP